MHCRGLVYTAHSQYLYPLVGSNGWYLYPLVGSNGWYLYPLVGSSSVVYVLSSCFYFVQWFLLSHTQSGQLTIKTNIKVLCQYLTMSFMPPWLHIGSKVIIILFLEWPGISLQCVGVVCDRFL